jgi:hypothetical protein
VRPDQLLDPSRRSRVAATTTSRSACLPMSAATPRCPRSDAGLLDQGNYLVPTAIKARRCSLGVTAGWSPAPSSCPTSRRTRWSPKRGSSPTEAWPGRSGHQRLRRSGHLPRSRRPRALPRGPTFASPPPPADKLSCSAARRRPDDRGVRRAQHERGCSSPSGELRPPDRTLRTESPDSPGDSSRGWHGRSARVQPLRRQLAIRLRLLGWAYAANAFVPGRPAPGPMVSPAGALVGPAGPPRVCQSGRRETCPVALCRGTVSRRFTAAGKAVERQGPA